MTTITQEMLDAQSKRLHDGLADVSEGIAALKAERDRLREALAFYANPDSYKGLPPGYAFVPIDKDSGALARSALNKD